MRDYLARASRYASFLRSKRQMVHNLATMQDGRDAIAFRGSREDIWHRLGQQMEPGMSIEAWAKEAGLDWSALMVPAYACLPETGLAGRHGDSPEGLMLARMRLVEGRKHVVRSDNGQPLGYVSDGYKPVQPLEVLNWFQQYIGVDDRFELDVAGCLKAGEIIWATATYRDALDIVGEKHTARLLMTTTFDGSGSTTNKGTMTRVVCNNTLDAAMSDPRATIRTRHNTAFNPKKVSDELARIAGSFETYKAMAEAMVAVHMSDTVTANFFKALLDIPHDAKRDDISAKKYNQLEALGDAYVTTLGEGAPKNTQWAALNALTRFVDHDRNTRGNGGEDEARLLSSNFGSGQVLKAKALKLLQDA